MEYEFQWIFLDPLEFAESTQNFLFFIGSSPLSTSSQVLLITPRC